MPAKKVPVKKISALEGNRPKNLPDKKDAGQKRCQSGKCCPKKMQAQKDADQKRSRLINKIGQRGCQPKMMPTKKDAR